jgi:hypothetical protein
MNVAMLCPVTILIVFLHPTSHHWGPGCLLTSGTIFTLLEMSIPLIPQTTRTMTGMDLHPVMGFLNDVSSAQVRWFNCIKIMLRVNQQTGL